MDLWQWLGRQDQPRLSMFTHVHPLSLSRYHRGYVRQ